MNFWSRCRPLTWAFIKRLEVVHCRPIQRNLNEMNAWSEAPKPVWSNKKKSESTHV